MVLFPLITSSIEVYYNLQNVSLSFTPFIHSLVHCLLNILMGQTLCWVLG